MPCDKFKIVSEYFMNTFFKTGDVTQCEVWYQIRVLGCNIFENK